jgi:hypothetical protein
MLTPSASKSSVPTHPPHLAEVHGERVEHQTHVVHVLEAVVQAYNVAFVVGVMNRQFGQNCRFLLPSAVHHVVTPNNLNDHLSTTWALWMNT